MSQLGLNVPKKAYFGAKMAFLFILGQALPAHLVGGCGARAVSRKTPIYFIYLTTQAEKSLQCFCQGGGASKARLGKGGDCCKYGRRKRVQVVQGGFFKC